MHKSLQEFCVAQAIVSEVQDHVRAALIAPAQLEATIESLNRLDPDDSSNSRSLVLHTKTSRKAVDGRAREPPEIVALLRLAESSGRSDESVSVQRRAASLARLMESLQRAALGTIDLAHEEAVRDFLLDALLSNALFASTLKAVLCLCALGESIHGGLLRAVGDNIAAAISLPLPRRDGETALHIALAEVGPRNLEGSDRGGS